jgi:PLP dependent protein
MSLAGNLDAIQRRIAAACGRCGRDPSSVQLLAVSKGHPPAVIQEALDLGLTHFGESKVQEAKAKIPQCPGRAHWQMIGHLQTNKARDAVQLFELVQSVDSLHLAEELSRRAGQLARTMPVLLEVNIAGEASKFGYQPDTLLAEIEQLNALPRLEIHGLMTMAPWSPHPERSRPVFRGLRELKARCEARLGAPLPQLSMGMSGDFEPAIEEGATLIRIGTALFGRPSSTPAPERTMEM